jgi:hypothetical protein
VPLSTACVLLLPGALYEHLSDNLEKIASIFLFAIRLCTCTLSLLHTKYYFVMLWLVHCSLVLCAIAVTLCNGFAKKVKREEKNFMNFNCDENSFKVCGEWVTRFLLQHSWKFFELKVSSLFLSFEIVNLLGRERKLCSLIIFIRRVRKRSGLKGM